MKLNFGAFVKESVAFRNGSILAQIVCNAYKSQFDWTIFGLFFGLKPTQRYTMFISMSWSLSFVLGQYHSVLGKQHNVQVCLHFNFITNRLFSTEVNSSVFQIDIITLALFWFSGIVNILNKVVARLSIYFAGTYLYIYISIETPANLNQIVSMNNVEIGESF